MISKYIYEVLRWFVLKYCVFLLNPLSKIMSMFERSCLEQVKETIEERLLLEKTYTLEEIYEKGPDKRSAHYGMDIQDLKSKLK